MRVRKSYIGNRTDKKRFFICVAHFVIIQIYKFSECAEDDKGCGSRQQERRQEMTHKKKISKPDPKKRDNEVRDLEPVKDAKGGLKPVSGGGGGIQIPPKGPTA